MILVTELALRNCNKFEGTLGNSGEILSYAERLSPQHEFASSANGIRAWGNQIALRKVEPIQTRNKLGSSPFRLPSDFQLRGLQRATERIVGMLLLLPSERINGGDGRRYDRCWEFRPREQGLRPSKGEGRERDESGSGCWERDVMLARRQRSMVARGSMGIIVGINTGCRRHLRGRWWGGWYRRERKCCEKEKEGETIDSESSKGVEPFL